MRLSQLRRMSTRDSGQRKRPPHPTTTRGAHGAEMGGVQKEGRGGGSRHIKKIVSLSGAVEGMLPGLASMYQIDRDGGGVGVGGR